MTPEEKELFLQEKSIAYLNVPDVSVLDSPDPNTSLLVSLVLPSYLFSRPDEYLKLDFYVLGNGESIGWENVGALKRSSMRDTVFSGDYFGTNKSRSVYYPSFDQVPAGGLPMACFFDNNGQGFDISFLKTNPIPTDEQMAAAGRAWPSMTLTRSVARMRFLFARSMGMTGVAIDSVMLYDYGNVENPGVIPAGSFVFPRENPPSSGIAMPEGVLYETLTWGSFYSGLERNIGQMEDPLVLSVDGPVMQGKSAAYFEQYVQDLLDQPGVLNKPTSKVLYLRESDRAIKGRIYYNGKRDDDNKLVTPSRSVEFTMENQDFPNTTNFYRNHAWTVYAFFFDSLNVNVSVVPWNETAGYFNLNE